MPQGRSFSHSRSVKRFAKYRQTARSFGVEPVCEFDPDLFDDDVLPAVAYAELFGGDWMADDVEERLDAAGPALTEQLAALHDGHSVAIAAWLNANLQVPDRPFERLPLARRQRLYELYPEWKGQAAYWNELQSREFHAMFRLQQACQIAHWEMNPPNWTRR